MSILYVLNAIPISLFCCGLYVVTQKGYILHFLRKPYDRAYDELEIMNQRADAGFSNSKKQYIKCALTVDVLKPIIGCHVCYASFWTLVLYTACNGVTEGYLFNVVVTMFIVAFFNALGVNIYHKLE